MTPQHLNELIKRFPQQRIAVLGDFFLDKYLDTDPDLVETSIETGKPAHQVVAVRCSPGAAGTVVNNLAALGAGQLHAIGAIGNDGEAYDLRKGLNALECTTRGLIESDSLMTPTYLKPRDISRSGLAGEHERYDTKNRGPTPRDITEQVVAMLDQLLPEVDAVIICDQVERSDHGVITAQVREALAERARRHSEIIFFADSRKHIRLFRNVMIKPNQFEAVGFNAPGPDDRVSLDEVKRAVSALRVRVGAPVCTTLGEQGILVSDPELTHIPGVRVNGPLDTTGAGDSATAGMVLALSAGATLPEAALVGNLVASITIQQLATTGTAHPDELIDQLELWQHQNPSGLTGETA